MQVWGYVPDSDREAAWATVREHRSLLTGVSLFQFHLDELGGISEYQGLGREPAWAARDELAVVPMVTNLIEGGWDRGVVARVLASADTRSRHIKNLVALAVEGDYPGLELDYEELAGEDRERLIAFITELASVLHERGKMLSLALHAKLNEPGNSRGARAQDWARLGQAADRLVIMTYDHDPSRAGPIAPITWTESVLQFALSQIEPARVIQGIPFYGYDWSSTGDRAYRTHSEVVSIAQANGMAFERDQTDGHVVLKYSDQAIGHEVWIPDALTVGKLAEVGRRVGVAGYAMWRMGGEAPGVWDVIGRMAHGSF